MRQVRTIKAVTTVSAAAMTCLGFAVPEACAVTGPASGPNSQAPNSQTPNAQAPGDLPPVGTAVALTEDGDMVFGCNGNMYRFDLHGTAQAVVGEPVPGSESPTRVLTTRAEDMLGFDPVLGQVTVTERGPARGELVSPVAGKTFPALVSLPQDVTVTMEHTPCDSSGAPATFVNNAPFALVNTNAKAFPPGGEVYTIVDPVAFHPSGEPDSPDFVTVDQFPVTVTKSS